MIRPRAIFSGGGAASSVNCSVHWLSLCTCEDRMTQCLFPRHGTNQQRSMEKLPISVDLIDCTDQVQCLAFNVFPFMNQLIIFQAIDRDQLHSSGEIFDSDSSSNLCYSDTFLLTCIAIQIPSSNCILSYHKNVRYTKVWFPCLRRGNDHYCCCIASYTSDL